MVPRVAIFWDIASCPLPEHLTGYEAVDSIRRIANSYGSVTVFRLYTETTEGPANPSRDIRTQLELCGVCLVECIRGANTSLPTQLPTDILVFALDNPTPATVLLISGNSNFTYPISLLRLRGYNVVLVVPSAMDAPDSLGSQASVILDWKVNVLETSEANKDHQQTRHQESEEQRNSPENKDARVHSTRLPSISKGSESQNVTPTVRPAAEMIGSWRRTINTSSLSRSKLGGLDSSIIDPSTLSPTDDPKISNIIMSSTAAPLYRPPVPIRTNYAPSRNFRKEVLISGKDTMIDPISRPPSNPIFLHSPTSRFSALHDASSDPTAYNSANLLDNVSLPVATELTSPGASSSSRGHPGAKMYPSKGPSSDDASHSGFPAMLHSREIFLPLITELTALWTDGNRTPLRSLVGTRLKKAVYAQAGVADFSQYVTLAESMGIVQLGGSGGKAWIALQSPERYFERPL